MMEIKHQTTDIKHQIKEIKERKSDNSNQTSGNGQQIDKRTSNHKLILPKNALKPEINESDIFETCSKNSSPT